MKICRLCLCKDEDKILSVLDHEIQDLAAKITEFVSVDIMNDDELPKFACTDCINQILQWEAFRNTCQESNEILIKSVIFGCSMLDESIMDVVEIVKEEHCNEAKKIRKEENDDEDEEDYIFLDCDANEKIEPLDDFLDLPDLPLKESSIFYECEICHLLYDNCFDYLDHQYEHKGEGIFKCDKCPEAFNTREEIIYHDRNHRIPCKICGKLVLRTSMKLHLVKHTDKYKCSQCKACCSSGAALKQHIITVHTNIKDHICETCGKCFSSLSSIRVHRKSHSENRMYQCKKCSYAGRTASALYIHMSTHANDLCVCEVCSKVFKSNRNLSDHLRRVHSEIKKHCCNYCNKCFVDKYMLKVHVRWHTNVRPYKCTLCTKAFIRSDGLKEHMNTHKQRTLVECFRCGRKFTSRQGVSRHNCLAVT